jgi:ABC-type nitrate/sulfonate/bicarbonate transport system substrate-binding protein
MEMTLQLEKLGKPAQRAILNSGITTLEELAALPEKEVAQWHGIGPNALIRLRTILAENGLSFSRSPVQGK